jgi:hypothetical protein
MMFLNKKGTEKIVGVYVFTILVIVLGGVWGMTNAYYNPPSDIRELEARVLSNQIADCISQKGVLNSNLFNATTGDLIMDFDLVKECNLNLAVENGYTPRDQYYIEVTFLENTPNKNLLSEIIVGEPSIKSDCENIQKVETYKLASKCNSERMYSTFNGKQFLIELLTGVRKTEKNVK